MTSKNKGQNPEAGRPGAPTSAGKRPHATLDLHATEVEIKAAGSTPAIDDTKTDAKASAAGSAKPSATATSGGSASAPTGSASASSSAAPKSSSAGGKPSGGSGGAAKPPPPRAGGSGSGGAGSKNSGVGRFFSLIAAAVLGGIVTLLGADFAADELGFGARGTAAPGEMQAVARRLAALEKTTSQKGAGQTAKQLTEQLAGTVARIEKLEAVAKTVTGLAAAQKGLLAKSDAMAAKLTAGGGGKSDAGGRIAKLEETLSAMRAAASADPSKSGRLPQLAGITGKLNDLEAALTSRLQALRVELSEHVRQQLAAVREVAAQAVAGSQRLDRDVQGLRGNDHKVDQSLVAVKVSAQRLAGAVKAVRDEAGALRAGLDALKLDIDGRFKSVARISDVKSAIQPVSERLTRFQAGLKQVVSHDQDRQANAARIILALELSNLRRALDRGRGFGVELAEVSKAGGGKLKLAALAKYQKDGVPTLDVLQRGFPGVAGAALDATRSSGEGSVLDRLVAGARSIVRVRRIDHKPEDTSSEAVIARMEAHLKARHLAGVLEEAQRLPEKSRDAIKSWLDKIAARQSVDTEIAKIESTLKGSLGGSASATKKGSK